MKLSKISLALVAVCGTIVSAPALALTASQWVTANTAGTVQNIYISGASAQDNGVLGSAASFCTGTLHRYTISNNFAYYCTPDNGTGAGQIQMETGKTSLAIFKYSAGGSGNGVDPVNLNQTLPFLDLGLIATSPACAGTNATVTVLDFDGSTGSFQPYTNVVCSASPALLTSGKTTFIGLSDVEPAFFSSLSPVNHLSTELLSSLIFAPIVTKNVRDALQTQQFGATCTGLETEACMPSLSRSQLVSLYTQAGQSWSGVLGAALAGVTDEVYVSRRVDSSGTQKTFEALLARSQNGQPAFKSCNTSTDPFVVPSDVALTGTSLTLGDPVSVCQGTSPLATLVHAGSGGGDVVNCLNAHNTAGRGAIGIQTAESKSATANWKYVKIDGKAPTHANVAKGEYTFYTDTAINTRTVTNPTEVTGNGYTKFLTAFKRDLKNPAIINQINGVPDAFGKSGLMASFISGTPDFTGASAINPWNRLVGGTALDNCQAGKLTF